MFTGTLELQEGGFTGFLETMRRMPWDCLNLRRTVSFLWLILLLAAPPVEAEETLSLAEALDIPGMDLTATGGWQAQTVETHDGVDAARRETAESGAWTNDTLTLSLTETALVRFWWKREAEGSFSVEASDGNHSSSGWLTEPDVWVQAEILAEPDYRAPFVEWDARRGTCLLDQVEVISPTKSLNEALDSDLPFEQLSEGAWLGWDSKVLAHDGEDFVSSHARLREEADLLTTVQGPGMLRWQWKGEGRLWLNDAPVAFLSTWSEDEWQERTIQIPGGEHLVRWSPSSQYRLEGLSLDQVNYDRGATD